MLVAKRLQGNIGSFGNGDTFYVDGISGNDSNSGKYATVPLQTIDAALALVTTEHDDYVFVMDCWSAGEPVEVDKSLVHIIALNNPQAPWACMNAGGDTNIFYASSTGNSSEIAGFNIGGGSTKSGMEINNCIGLWIHHNSFGHEYSSDTPLYGIYNGGTYNPAFFLIEDNYFFGDQVNANGTITSNAIVMSGGASAIAKNGIIRNNVFMGLTGASNAGAISISGGKGIQILDNTFFVPDAASGEAINIVTTSTGLVIMGNRAANGMLSSGYTYNPFRDTNANTINAWALNYQGNAIVEPVGV